MVEEDLYGDGNGDSEGGAARSGAYCVVCSKRFKSEKQLRNHEKSKKHRQKLQEMRRFLEEEERAMGPLRLPRGKAGRRPGGRRTPRVMAASGGTTKAWAWGRRSLLLRPRRGAQQRRRRRTMMTRKQCWRG